MEFHCILATMLGHALKDTLMFKNDHVNIHMLCILYLRKTLLDR